MKSIRRSRSTRYRFSGDESDAGTVSGCCDTGYGDEVVLCARRLTRRSSRPGVLCGHPMPQSYVCYALSIMRLSTPASVASQPAKRRETPHDSGQCGPALGQSSQNISQHPIARRSPCSDPNGLEREKRSPGPHLPESLPACCWRRRVTFRHARVLLGEAVSFTVFQLTARVRFRRSSFMYGADRRP